MVHVVTGELHHLEHIAVPQEGMEPIEMPVIRVAQEVLDQVVRSDSGVVVEPDILTLILLEHLLKVVVLILVVVLGIIGEQPTQKLVMVRQVQVGQDRVVILVGEVLQEKLVQLLYINTNKV
jgi:hypothetical protein